MPRLLSLFSTLLTIAGGAVALVYEDGKMHSLDGQTTLDEAVSLRSSSKLTLPPGDYAIRSPAGSVAGIRLQMSSFLNATGGDVMGADVSADHPAAGAGVIVGSASRAVFYEGATVRGGNRQGRGEQESTNIYANGDGGNGGDALISQYYASNVTIYGGNFMAGKGSARDGYSLHASYEAEIYVHGGSFYGSWMASGGGSIVVNGCVSRIGTRLVGRLENGHSLDVQVFEEGKGTIVLNNPEKCNHYRKRPSSSAGRGGLARRAYLWGAMVILLSSRQV